MTRRGIPHRRRPLVATDVECIQNALRALRLAHTWLTLAQAHHAADYVQRAIKSTDGARRHAEGRLARQEAAETRSTLTCSAFCTTTGKHSHVCEELRRVFMRGKSEAAKV